MAVRQSIMRELSNVLQAGEYLVNSPTSVPAPNLKALLLSRLAQYNAQLGRFKIAQDLETLDDAQSETANQALHVLERVHHILTTYETSQTDVPTLGTHDLVQLRTLMSIVFNWRIHPLLTRVAATWSSKTSSSSLRNSSNSIDLIDYHELSSATNRLLALLFPSASNDPPQSFITTMLLDRHLSDLLKPCIALGWLPKTLASESAPTVDQIRPMVMRLLSLCANSYKIAS